MINGYFLGASYAKLEPGEELDLTPVPLGDLIIKPGDFVNKLGHKARSMFEMKEGWYLRYLGRVDRKLLFDTNTKSCDPKGWAYAFDYVDRNTLLVGSTKGCSDIKIQTIEIFKNVPLHDTVEQMTMEQIMP